MQTQKYQFGTSNFHRDFTKAEEIVAEIRGKLEAGEAILKNAEKDTKGVDLVKKSEVTKIAREQVLKLEEELLTDLMMAPNLVTVANNQLRKRVYEKNRIQKKEENVKIEGCNLAATWKDCLDELSGPKTSYGVTFLLEDFVHVNTFCDGLLDACQESFTITELCAALDRPAAEVHGIQKLVVSHLPVIMMGRGQKSVLMDRRVFLMSPERIMELYELTQMEETEEEDSTEVKKPKRAAGQERPSGSFLLREEQIEDIKQFIGYCGGMAAHDHKRFDY